MDHVAKFKTTLNNIHQRSKTANLVVVTKGQTLDTIKPIINLGHHHFGENRVREAILKWETILKNNSDISLHLIGKLQSNKAKEAIRIFKFIHSLDSLDLAKKLRTEELRQNKKLRYFIQINIGNETQKSGVSIENLDELVNQSLKELNLNILGFMCIPPINSDVRFFFKKMKNLALKYKFNELSMGMSNDYIVAIEEGATCVRVGSAIFNN